MGLLSLLPSVVTEGPFGNFVNAIFKPIRQIGPFMTQVTIEEDAHDELTITRHPVATGAAITDHSYKEPAEVLIRCSFSNSSLAALISDVAGVLSLVQAGSFGPLNYSRQVYQQILALQESRIPFTVTTGKRTYPRMLLKRISQPNDVKTENILMVTLHCEQILTASTSIISVLNTNGTTPTPADPLQTDPIAQNGTQSCTIQNPTGEASYTP